MLSFYSDNLYPFQYFPILNFATLVKFISNFIFNSRGFKNFECFKIHNLQYLTSN